MMRRGDHLLVHSGGFVADAICRAQEVLTPGDDKSAYGHVALITSRDGYIFESAKDIGYSHIRKYVGKQVLIARPKKKSGVFDMGLRAVLRNEGKKYPTWRLLLHALKLADNLHPLSWPVCSETLAMYDLAAQVHTGIELIDQRRHWAGVTPMDYELAIKRNPDLWEIIFEGNLQRV